MPSPRRSEAEKASIKQGGGNLSKKSQTDVPAQKRLEEKTGVDSEFEEGL